MGFAGRGTGHSKTVPKECNGWGVCCSHQSRLLLRPCWERGLFDSPHLFSSPNRHATLFDHVQFCSNKTVRNCSLIRFDMCAWRGVVMAAGDSVCAKIAARDANRDCRHCAVSPCCGHHGKHQRLPNIAIAFPLCLNEYWCQLLSSTAVFMAPQI